jgi:hypothetical protein
MSHVKKYNPATLGSHSFMDHSIQVIRSKEDPALSRSTIWRDIFDVPSLSVYLEKRREPDADSEGFVYPTCYLLLGSYRSALLFDIDRLRNESSDKKMFLPACVGRLLSREYIIFVGYGFGHHNRWDFEYLGLNLNMEHLINMMDFHDPYLCRIVMVNMV